MPRKKANIQKKFRDQKFRYGQFWNIHYTEKYKNGSEKDFKTIIKARSYLLAKEILYKKMHEDDPVVKVKAVQGFMFHKDYCISMPVKKPIGYKEWEQIHAAAFPNENNILFKIETPRKEGYTNRFNDAGTNKELIKKIGFKKGEENWSHINKKGKSLPKEERPYKIYSGKWHDWDNDLREQKKNEIIDALEEAGNNRSKAAKILQIDRNQLYHLFDKFPEVDFSKDYPAPIAPPPAKVSKEEYSARAKKGWQTMINKGIVPFGGKSNTPEANRKRIKSLQKTMKEKRLRKYKELEPKIRKALSINNNNRIEAAKYLNMDITYFRKCMHQMKKELGIDWGKEYRTKHYQ